MPMFQPSAVVRVDGQVLDLDTAVKDGVLGGGYGGGGYGGGGYGGGGGGGEVGGGGEELDLRQMIEELNSYEVPSVFICPISLEPMQEPVTLCTGQTYERCNILKWLSLGHCTCPTTMQELWDDSITPNTTLLHLIHSWYSHKYFMVKKRAEDVQGRTLELMETLKKAKGRARMEALMEVQQMIGAHLSAKKAVMDASGIAVISSMLGPFTTHAVGSEAIAILVNLPLDSDSNPNLMQPAKMSLIIDMLNEGSIRTKMNCVKLIGKVMEQKDFRSELVMSHSLLAGLMRLAKDKRYKKGTFSALSLLKSICSLGEARSLVVRVGVIPQLVDLLPSFDSDSLEPALVVLDSLSSLPEGRLALKDHPNTIPNIVKLLMRISESCTQYALSVLWSVCELAPEECSSAALDAGLAAKLLLVIQSGFNPLLKQQSSELLKLCRLNYTDTIFISKCKLTRTIH